MEGGEQATEGRTRRSSGGGGGRSHPPPAALPADRQETKKKKKIPVVYYLCRNRHLDHPHFIEVSVSSSSPGLLLRDVLDRLAALRGPRMASLYAWSCKRSYKNGFVWQDLSEEDLVFANHGDEYVLKGSEIFFSENARATTMPAVAPTGSSVEQRQRPRKSGMSSDSVVQRISCDEGRCRSEKKEATTGSSSSFSSSSISSPSSSTNDSGRGRGGGEEPSGNASPETKRNSSQGSGGGFSLPPDSADASTQTDEGNATASRGILSTTLKEVSEITQEVINISPQPATRSSSSTSSAGVGEKSETLESLIRADARMMSSSFRILEEEEGEDEVVAPITGKLKATDVLMQLITCGSISVKDHHRHRHSHLGFIPTYYKPSFSQVNFPSPAYTDYLSERSTRFMGLRFEEKGYFSGSFLEVKKKKTPPGAAASGKEEEEEEEEEGGGRRLKRCSSDSGSSKCLPRTMMKTKKEPTTETPTRSPTSDAPPRISSDSRRGRGLPRSDEEGGGEVKKLVKIEERLTSGAKVIIQSRPPPRGGGGGSTGEEEEEEEEGEEPVC